MKVWVLQHIQVETLGTIAQALDTQGIAAHYVRSFAGEAVPESMDDAAGLIVMGGPMGVYEKDRHPFLRAEMRLIEQALKAEKPILGVCLGSQLLAATLGAEVKKGKIKEIGWYPITLSEACRSDPLWAETDPHFTAYHWHGDIFDLPRGAVSLASSALTECQAYRYGSNAYGFLFHMEVTDAIIEAMVRTFSVELQEQGLDGGSIVAQAEEHLAPLQQIGGGVFQSWARLLGPIPAR
jgi:GMP synthase (glutamine-hydrolysing)